MNKNVVVGIIVSLVIVAVIVTLAVFFVNKGNTLKNAVAGGSCTGDPTSCSMEKSSGCSSSSSPAGCSSQVSSCSGSSNPYLNPNVDYKAIEKQAIDLYASKTGDKEVIAKAIGNEKITVVIIKGDKEVARYIYEKGNFVQ
jgi:hypothetical protein